MKTVIVFLADGVEECEALGSIDLMRRAGINVITASVMGRPEIKGAHDVVLLADCLAEDADYESADMVVLPGGGVGTENLGKSEIVKEKCISFAKDKKAALGADITIENFTDETVNALDMLDDLDDLSKQTQKDLLKVGIDTEENNRSGSFLQVDQSNVFTNNTTCAPTNTEV